MQCRGPWLGRSPGEGHDNPLQYSVLENSHGPGGLHSKGSQRIGHNWATQHTLVAYTNSAFMLHTRFWNINVLRCLYEAHKYKTLGEGFIFGEMEEGIIVILKIRQGKKYWNCKSFLTSFLYLLLLFEIFLKWMLWSRDRNEMIRSLKISGF